MLYSAKSPSLGYLKLTGVNPDQGPVTLFYTNKMTKWTKKTKTGLSYESEEVKPNPRLPVAPFTDTFTPESTPSTGEEYLALVQVQRESLPRVYSSTKPQLASIDAACLGFTSPTTKYLLASAKEVLDVINAGFYSNPDGEKLSNPQTLPALNDRNGWLGVIYSQGPTGMPTESAPLPVSDIFELPKGTCFRLATFHITWLSPSTPILSAHFLARAFSILRFFVSQRIDPLDLLAKDQASMRMLAQVSLFYCKPKDSAEYLQDARAIVILIAKRFGQSDLIKVSEDGQ